MRGDRGHAVGVRRREVLFEDGGGLTQPKDIFVGSLEVAGDVIGMVAIPDPSSLLVATLGRLDDDVQIR